MLEVNNYVIMYQHSYYSMDSFDGNMLLNDYDEWLDMPNWVSFKTKDSAIKRANELVEYYNGNHYNNTYKVTQIGVYCITKIEKLDREDCHWGIHYHRVALMNVELEDEVTMKEYAPKIQSFVGKYYIYHKKLNYKEVAYPIYSKGSRDKYIRPFELKYDMFDNIADAINKLEFYKSLSSVYLGDDIIIGRIDRIRVEKYRRQSSVYADITNKIVFYNNGLKQAAAKKLEDIALDNVKSNYDISVDDLPF